MQRRRHTKQASCPVCGGQLACFLGVCDEEGEGDVRSLGTRCAARSSSCEYSIKGKCDGSLSVMREKMSVLPSLADFFRQWDGQTEKFALLCSKTKPPIMKKGKACQGRNGMESNGMESNGMKSNGRHMILPVLAAMTPFAMMQRQPRKRSAFCVRTRPTRWLCRRSGCGNTVILHCFCCLQT